MNALRPRRRGGRGPARAAIAAACSAWVAGCATVPPEAPAAAEALGTRLERFEEAHMTLLDALFETHRVGIERFVATRWQPRFVDEFLGAPETAALVAELGTGGGSSDALGEWLGVALPALIDTIEAERRALIDPLEGVERDARRQAHDAFAEARLLGRALEGWLVAERELVDAESGLLETFGVGEGARGRAAALADDVEASAAVLLSILEDLEAGHATARGAGARLEGLRRDATVSETTWSGATGEER